MLLSFRMLLMSLHFLTAGVLGVVLGVCRPLIRTTAECARDSMLCLPNGSWAIG